MARQRFRGGQKPCMLKDVRSGCRARVRCHHGTRSIRQRLLDLGFLPQAEIDVIRRAPLGDPIQCRIGSCCVVLRGSEAAQIEVDEAETPRDAEHQP
ncbi:FeoA family protein [Desulfofustis glycolicus]|uniref:Ferrous iron transport protein A n=1 Tax=Desulfofustis glycolicus DSM 9705 TaxID=1121409 RepID=A0A1M5YMN6_9BACT|nr:FeoA family protein [Desulfofustis glycolicus]SHI13357.1 ferrous iron transport protein A [Desulfofustis glycolicus DSM 9705]